MCFPRNKVLTPQRTVIATDKVLPELEVVYGRIAIDHVTVFVVYQLWVENPCTMNQLTCNVTVSCHRVASKPIHLIHLRCMSDAVISN